MVSSLTQYPYKGKSSTSHMPRNLASQLPVLKGKLSTTNIQGNNFQSVKFPGFHLLTCFVVDKTIVNNVPLLCSARYSWVKVLQYWCSHNKHIYFSYTEGLYASEVAGKPYSISMASRKQWGISSFLLAIPQISKDYPEYLNFTYAASNP